MADPHPRAANSEMSPAALLPGCDSVVRLMRKRWLAARRPCGRSPVPRWRGERRIGESAPQLGVVHQDSQDIGRGTYVTRRDQHSGSVRRSLWKPSPRGSGTRR
jgi:hypothetical protein